VVFKRKLKGPVRLTPWDRVFFGLAVLGLGKSRISPIAIVLNPATILKFHRALVKRKYRLLFSSSKNKPGPKGPSKELIAFILQMKQRNPGYGCPKIALVVENCFGIKMSEDTVRRILRMHLKPSPGKGPSWLTFIGHTKDSLWSIDFFRVESIFLRSYWVMVVMDQFSRRIVGVAVRKANLDGPVICQMFQEVLQGSKVVPKYLSSDHDPLFKYHRWQSNLRILEINEIKTVPHFPSIY